MVTVEVDSITRCKIALIGAAELSAIALRSGQKAMLPAELEKMITDLGKHLASAAVLIEEWEQQ